MSVTAYVMLNIKAGEITPVIDEIAKIEVVKRAYPITGDYDALLEIEVEKPKMVEELVINKIQKIASVEKTKTHIAFK